MTNSKWVSAILEPTGSAHLSVFARPQHREDEPPRRVGFGHVILILMTAFVCLYPYPGQATADTIDQILQARSGNFNDQHAWPLLVIWHPLYRFGLHEGTMFVATTALFAIAGYTIARWALRPNAAAVFVALAMVTPPVLAQLQAFGTDDWTLEFSLTATACLGVAIRCRPHPRWNRPLFIILGFVFMWLAAGSRRNALPLVIPLAVPLAAGILRFQRKYARMPRFSIGALFAGACIIVTTGMILVSQQWLYQVGHVRPLHGEAGLMVYDLASISVLENRVLLPPFSFSAQDMRVLRAYHHIGTIDDIVYSVPPIVKGDKFPAAERAALLHLWINAIRTDPPAYLWSRALLTGRLLGVHGEPYDVVGDNLGGYGIEPKFPSAVRAVDNYTHFGGHADPGFLEEGPIYFSPWPYLLVFIFATVGAVKGRLGRPTLILVASLTAGHVLYLGSFAVLSASTTYRYVFPSVATGILLLPITLRGWIAWWQLVQVRRRSAESSGPTRKC